MKFSDAISKTMIEQVIYEKREIPGPSQYQDPMNTSSLSTRGAGKISDANVPGQIDQAIYAKKGMPGPGQYALPSTLIVGGGKFNDAAPETYLETIIRTSSRTPGPNLYQDNMNTSSLSTIGVGKISDANVPGNIDTMVNKTKGNPGPSKYTLPAFGHGVGGVKFSDAISKTMIEQVIYAKREIPGPDMCRLHFCLFSVVFVCCVNVYYRITTMLLVIVLFLHQSFSYFLFYYLHVLLCM